MKNFRVQIREELSRIVQIEAEYPDKAIENAKSLYLSKEIVLDADDFCGEAEITLFQDEWFTDKDSELFLHINKIIEYFYEDEKKDYEQSQYPRNHIYHSICFLKEYVKKYCF